MRSPRFSKSSSAAAVTAEARTWLEACRPPKPVRPSRSGAAASCVGLRSTRISHRWLAGRSALAVPRYRTMQIAVRSEARDPFSPRPSFLLSAPSSIGQASTKGRTRYASALSCGRACLEASPMSRSGKPTVLRRPSLTCRGGRTTQSAARKRPAAPLTNVCAWTPRCPLRAGILCRCRTAVHRRPGSDIGHGALVVLDP